MRVAQLIGLAVMLCCGTAAVALGAQASPTVHKDAHKTVPRSVKHLHIPVPMRDGVHLYANIFRPPGADRVPTVLIRTPYDKGADITPTYQAFVDRGYAFVVEDVRGRYESQGIFAPLAQEPLDGDDTLNWIAQQPWSDGNIGMMGGSYLGISQWKVALLNNPHLKAIFPIVSGDDDYVDRFYSTGGALKLGNRLLWISENLRAPNFEPPDFRKFISTVPLRRADLVATGQRSSLLQAALDHPTYDAFWKSISTREQLKQLRTPVFSVGGWFDNFVESDLDAYTTLRKHSSVHRIMIGPWPHNMSIPLTGVDFGPDSYVPLRRVQLEWFDQWLKNKDVPLMSRPPVKLFVMGANQWREEYEWPLARARPTKFYLQSGGHANTLNGDGSLIAKEAKISVPDQYIFDPRNPAPTMGGAVCCNPKVFAWGPMDQRPVEKRFDVLVYTTPPLNEDLEVTGPVLVKLDAASSAPDTDFSAKLVDVFPNGEARNLTDGLLRARYRESLSKPKLMKPGEIYTFKIDAGVTSNLFKKGHRVRLEISSSNFPRFDRNPNTGRPIADEVELRKASQVIYHDRAHPSYVLLPVVPNAGHELTSASPARYFPKRPHPPAR